jgi:hypothetical protein
VFVHKKVTQLLQLLQHLCMPDLDWKLTVINFKVILSTTVLKKTISTAFATKVAHGGRHVNKSSSNVTLLCQMSFGKHNSLWRISVNQDQDRSEVKKQFLSSKSNLMKLIGQKLTQNKHWPMKILRFQTELRKSFLT